MRRSLVWCSLLAFTGAIAAQGDTSIGQKPLSERAVDVPADWYLGVGEPGLYPGGANQPSGAHLALAEARSTLVHPLPPPAGSTAPAAPAIGVVAVGMSNTNQEWARFERLADGDGSHAGRVVLVDGALGGIDAIAMADPGNAYWTVFDQRLTAAGLAPAQVQVVWLKQGLLANNAAFPGVPDLLRDRLVDIVGILRARLPNLRLHFFSSRIYGGHAGSGQPSSGEPMAFETAFGVKELLGLQVADLAGSGAGLAAGPWLGWGPYLWADGVVPRVTDGLTWPITDLESDHTHPGPSGEQKVADLLHDFLAGDPRTAGWYGLAAQGPGEPPAPTVRVASADAHVQSAAPTVNAGGATALALGAGHRILLAFDLTGLATVERAKLSLLVGPDAADQLAGFRLYLAAASFDESTVTWDTQPPLGAQVAQVPGISRGGVVGVDVTGVVNSALAASATHLDLVLDVPGGPVVPGFVSSREGADPPRLVLVPRAAALLRDDFETADFAGWAAHTP